MVPTQQANAMPKYFEILFCPMFWDSEPGGDASYLDPLDRAEDRAPDFFDVEVLRHQQGGEIDCIEDYGDLTREAADRIFAEMIEKYPQAQQSILP